MSDALRKFYKWFFHDKLGWHNGKGMTWHDGCSRRSTCSLCGQPVMQDSQGNWFEVST